MIRLSHIRSFLRRAHQFTQRSANIASKLRQLSYAKAEGEAVRSEATSPLSLKGCLVQPSLGVSPPEKRFQSCRSVDEVLYLTFDGDDIKPNELIACLDALVSIQYSLLRGTQWAYYDSDLTLWVQANINSEAEDYFRCLHRHHMFKDLLHEVDKVVDTLSGEEVVRTLHSLLKLCVAKEHEVLLRLQEKSLQECSHLELRSLGLLSEVGNFMKRNGFVFNCRVCSLVQNILERNAVPNDSYHNLAIAASNIAYFSSTEFVNLLLEKAADLLLHKKEAVSFHDSLRYLEIAAKFSTLDTVDPFLQHMLENCDKLTIHQLCRLARLVSFQPTKNAKAVVRSEALARLEEGLLRTSDVVSLVGIFDASGWSGDIWDEFLDLLSIHVPDFDTLLIKHFANSNFVTQCLDYKFMRQFANRWIQKLSDISESVSVLMILVSAYNKTAIIPRYAQLVLQDKLLEKMREGQLSVHPDKVVTCCHFLLKYGTLKATQFAVRLLHRMRGQLTPRQIYSLQRAVVFKKSLAQQHCLPRAWYQTVLDRKDEIFSLNIASGLFNKFFPARSLLLRHDAVTWANILEDNARFVTLAAFRSVMQAVATHRLYLPDALEKMSEFALDHTCSFVTVNMLLTACASVDYRPSRIAEFSEVYVPRLLEEVEKDWFVKYALLFACNLLKLDCPPKSLVESIFTLDFMRRLDKAVEGFVDTKAIDGLLFEINQCAILQCPELDVPWLHTKFMKKLRGTTDQDGADSMLPEIDKALKEVMGGPEFVQTRTETPYLHTTDFECYISDSFGPVTRRNAKSHPEIPVKKLAVMLLGPHDFCSNEDRLVGSTAVKLRHLEIMGYTIVKVPHYELPDPSQDLDAVRQYLQRKIFPR